MKHWAFDLDGTLVDSFSHYFLSLEKIFKEHGATFTKELHYPALTEPLIELFETHIGREAIEGALVKLQAHSNADADHIKPFEGFMALFETLHKKGARIAVWTNRDLESAALILEKTGLGRYAEICVSGTCVAQRKPHPEGLLTIAKHFGCDPSEITMVGDHEHDVNGAKAAGARAVRASWHGYWVFEDCPQSDWQFHRIDDFKSWVETQISQKSL